MALLRKTERWRCTFLYQNMFWNQIFKEFEKLKIKCVYVLFRYEKPCVLCCILMYQKHKSRILDVEDWVSVPEVNKQMEVN